MAARVIASGLVLGHVPAAGFLAHGRYTFLPMADKSVESVVYQADAAVLISKKTQLQSLSVDLGITVVADQAADDAATQESRLLLVRGNDDSLERLSAAPRCNRIFPIDAGPFSSVDEAAYLMRRWLQEFWECHRADETGETNSCFAFGGCHRRCWWRGAIGPVVLTLDVVGFDLTTREAAGSSALAYLLERTAATHDGLQDRSAFPLRGAILLVESKGYYVGLRPELPMSSSARRSVCQRAQPPIMIIEPEREVPAQLPLLLEQPIDVRPTTWKGLGAFALTAIPIGTPVCTYQGDRLTRAELEERYGSRLDQCEYLFDLGNGAYIDASNSGHASRYINHDEHGNLVPSLSRTDSSAVGVGTDRIDFYATRQIEPGEELTFDYGLGYWAARGSDPSPDSDSRIPQIRIRRALGRLGPIAAAIRNSLPL